MYKRLAENKIINKILRQLVTIFVFNASKRRTLRAQLLRIATRKDIENIQKKYSDYWIFSLFFPWGDFGIACALMKEFKNQYGGKVLVLVNDRNRKAVAELFPSIDKVLFINSEVYDYIFQNPNFKIEKGKYFEVNHWKFFDAPKYRSKNFLELYANMLGINDFLNIEQPIFPKEITEAVNEKIKKLQIDINNTVFISKESNSFDCKLLDDNFWISKAEEYEKDGCCIIFNSKKKKFKRYKTIFLPMAEQLYFCSLCKKVIAIRSGFNDLLGIMQLKNMEIYYPPSMFFKTVLPFVQMIEFKRAFYDEEDKTFDENMYRITSLKMFGGDTINEIIVSKD